MSYNIIFAFVLITAGVATAFPHDESERADDVIDGRGEREIAGAAFRDDNGDEKRKAQWLEDDEPARAEDIIDEGGERETDFRDVYEEKRKVAVADKISGAELVVSALDKLLRVMQNVARKVAVGIDNETGNKWMHGSVYFFSGTADAALPYEIENGEALLFPARKTAGPVATGAVGATCWCEENKSYSICVLYSVPFDYNLYDNWWNVKRYGGCKKAGYNVYYDLYYNASPFKASGSWQQRNLGGGLKMRGYMSPSADSTLEIHVERA